MTELLEWPTADPLSIRAGTTPDRTALIDVQTDRTWTYREFDRHVDYVASSLEAVHSRSRAGGDGPARIAVLSHTRPAIPRLLFAAMRLGYVLAPLNVRETVTEIEAKLDRIDPTAFVCERATESVAAEGTDGPVYSLDEPTADAPDRISELRSHGGPNAVEPTSLECDDPATLLFTSGTTGEPKGVRLTAGNLVASATASAFRLGISPSDRWLCCLPTYHMGGLAPIIRSTLYGTTIVIQRAFDPERTARAIDDYEITGISLVPTMLDRLLESGWTGSETLRFVLLGGASPSDELLERARAAEISVYPTYGMTETASQIATATPEQAARYEGTSGQPLYGTDITVVDEELTPLEPTETGELIVSGPTVMAGYLDAERTSEAFCEYGFRTGDFGYRDRDGRLWVGDRRADRIVTGGENVDPSEVEAVLEDVSEVSAVAVVGLDDPEWGERVAALVAPSEVSLETLRERCADRLAGFKRPKTIATVDALPRTASGTVDREQARAVLRSNGLEVSEPDDPSERE